ncbi:oligosaccharide flippase family protein [Nocardioides marmotae]|uniref:oligosaccharide flippase family protein n=1 Tax=Nocardioides marmotae TaxID=2663857 RepID=UPI0012B511C1|nr:oligosaccharide flippase family protein [Nocardioides marmotae]MBC9731726.1 oligosaccharide flippase family protein [Nocardioides marmotae]MTB82848.1 oligosaccharide flippase family protein [Nocardioides marmotae]
MSAPAAASEGILGPFRSLLTAQVVGAGLGFLFWVLVARLVPAHEVGVAAAAISTQTLLGLVTSLGLGTLLVAELPVHPPARQRRLVQRSLLAVVLAGLVLGATVAAAAGLLGPNLAEALGHPAGALVFVAGVAAAGCALVLDEATLGLRRSSLQVWRNLLASSLRFPLAAALLLAGTRDALVLQLCWVLPLVVSLLVAASRLRLPRPAADAGGPALGADVATYARPALRHHGLNLAVASGTAMVPVVAGVVLTSVANAELAVAWMLATFAFLPPYLLAVALFAHGANTTTEELRGEMRTTLPAALLLSLTLCLGAWALGRPVLAVFGGEYAAGSYPVLALLVPAGLWMVLKDHLVTLWRVQRRHGLATRLAGAGVLLELTGATLGGVLGGAVGLCAGWLAAMVVEAVLARRWLREAFGGLAWRLPLPPRRAERAERAEAGQARWPVLVAAAVVVAAVAAAVVATGGTGGSSSGPGSSQPSTPAASDCDPAASSDPVLDLGVQAATGDRAAPLLPVRTVRRLVDLAAEAGADVVSTSVSWRTVQPRRGARPDWAALDRVLAAAQRRGLDVRVQVVDTPDWAHDPGTPGGRWRAPLSDAELDRWAGWVTRLVEHLAGRATYLEVWTEPNSTEFWSTGPDPAAFARLLEVTAEAVDRARGGAGLRLVSGGLAGNDVGYLERLIDELGTDAGADLPVDLVGVHPYSPGAPDVRAPERVFEREPFGTYDENFLGFERLHDLLVERGLDVPLYLGEFGYPTTDYRGFTGVPDEQRAAYAVAALDVVGCTPYVEALSWYYLHPTPWNPATWTLLDEQLKPSATWAALRDRAGGRREGAAR